MAISSGLRHALSEGASWLCAGLMVVGAVVYHEELRTTAYAAFGIEMPAGEPGQSPSAPPHARLSEAELRLRNAEARAAEAEARARKAEAQARNQQASAGQSQSGSGRSRPQYGNIVELKASRDGHYYAQAELNGRPVGVLVDTGATSVALTFEDAQRAGINVSNSDFTGITQTANGRARYAPVTIDRITIGNITVENVRGAVAEPGRMTVSLLGMSFLGKLIRSEMRSGVLVLEN
jgi:aspartyl protease family protein